MFRALTVFCAIAYGGSVLGQSPPPNTSVTGNCGAQCIYTLLIADSIPVANYSEFLHQHPNCHEAAISLDALAETARNSGLECELIRFDPTGELPLCRHLIAHVDSDHFVILSRQSRGLWYSVDPPAFPTVLSPKMRSQLSGAALAVGLEHDRRLTFWIAFAITITVVFCLSAHRLWGRSKRALATACCVFVVGSQGGCSLQHDSQTPLPVASKSFDFEPAVIELGDVLRSKEPQLIEMRLIGIAVDDNPKFTTSCGCAHLSMGEYDIASSSRAVTVRIVPETLDTKRVHIAAVSSLRNHSATAEITYRVVGRIAVQSERPVFESQEDSNLYVGHIQIVADKDSELARVEVLFTREQREQGFEWQSYRESDSRFAIEISNPADAGYEHAYLSFFDDKGVEVHPEIPIEWGQVSDLKWSVEQLQLSALHPSTSVVLHSDHELPKLKTATASTADVKVVTSLLASNLLRIELSIPDEKGSSIGNHDGTLTLEFEGDCKATIPLTVQQP